MGLAILPNPRPLRRRVPRIVHFRITISPRILCLRYLISALAMNEYFGDKNIVLFEEFRGI